MARLGIGLTTVERLLNHQSGSFGGIVQVYQQYDFLAERRHAVDVWGAHLMELVEDNVRLMKRA
jgi:hypothetical protein